MEPSVAPLRLPEGYGTATDTIPWAQTRKRLERSLHYWIATTAREQRPHVVPRWGVWLEDSWYYDGSPATRHARNLEQNPAAVLHLEDGKEAVVLEGESRPVVPDPGLAQRLVAAFAKYHELGYEPQADQWDHGGLWCFRPARGFAWRRYPDDATRYTFEEEEA